MKKKLLFTLLGIFTLLCTERYSAQIKINEVVVTNTMYYDQIKYNFSDWIELYNSGTTTVDVKGYYFSDDPANPTKWQLTTSTPIAAKSYVRILFYTIDGKEDVGYQIIANFKLEPKGGSIYVYNPQKILVDQVTYPKLNNGNVSYARLTDGGEEWGTMAYPTPRKANTLGEPSTLRVEEPVFSETGGFFTGTKTIMLSCTTPGAKIYYTVNGDEPFDAKGITLLTNESKMLSGKPLEYTGTPITINKSTVIRAKVYAPGYLPSTVVTQSYLLREREISLPVFSVSTNEKYRDESTVGIWANYTDRTMKRPANIEFYPTQDSKADFNYQMDIEIFAASARAKKHKQFNIIADNRYQGKNRMKYDFFNEKFGQKRKSVTLRSSGQDGLRTLMQDGLIQILIKDQMDIDRRAYQPAVAFMNGKYYGLMNIRERTQKDFLESNYGYEKGEYDLLGAHMEEGKFSFRASQGDFTQWNEMISYLKVNNLRVDETYNQFVDKYIDETEVLNYFLVQTYINNIDCIRDPGVVDNNIKAWRPYFAKGNMQPKWRYILHDLDLALVNNFSPFNTSVSQNRISGMMKNDPKSMGYVFYKLGTNEKFQKKFAARYITHAFQTFSPGRTTAFIDSISAMIAPEIPYTYATYPTEAPSPTKWKGYVDEMKEWWGARQKYVVPNLKSAFGFTGNEVDFIVDHDLKVSDISLNTVKLLHTFGGKYIQGLEYTLSLIPKPGFEFTHWDVWVITPTGSTVNKVYKQQFTDVIPEDASKVIITPNYKSSLPVKTIYVKEGASGDGSTWVNAMGDLQEAINKSNSGDSIWVAKGMYKPVRKADNLSVITENHRDNAFVLKKNVKVFGGFSGNETRFSQRDWKSHLTILSGDLGVQNDNSDNAYHVVIIPGLLGNTELNGFTITDGNADGADSQSVNGQAINRNSGGGIVTSLSTPVLSNLILKNNKSSMYGGAVYSTSASGINLSGSEIINNKAEYGGGIYNDKSNLSLSSVTIQGNISRDGGGLYNIESSSELINVRISDNQTSGFGGGIFNKKSPILLVNTAITGNKANTGGGIFIENSASSKLINATVSDNQASAGSGIFNHSMSPEIQNSIIWGNSPSGSTISNYNGTPVYTYSLVQGATGTDSKGNISGNINPLFVDNLFSNYRLQAESPVINKGNNTYISSDITTDLEGNPRIKEGTIDMGSYEYQAIPIENKTIYVKEGASGDGSTWTNALGDLQEAINKSNSGDSIWVAKGTYKPVRKADNLSVITENHRDNAFVLKKNIKVFGGFSGNETRFSQRDWKSNPAILSGDLGVQGIISDNAYHVVVASGDLGEAELDGFTLTAGNADNTNWSVLTVNGNNIFRNCGGAFYAASSSVVLNNLVITENQAFTSGGGIRLDAGNVTISNTVFSNNKVTDGSFGGGALYNNKGTVTLFNSLFYKNKTARGSAIYNESAKNTSFINVTMSDNEGRTMYNDTGSTLQIRNSIVWGDAGTNYGKLDYMYSLIQGVTDTDSKGNISGNTDPLFVDSQFSDYNLQIESPVINKGNNTYLPSNIAIDLAGNPRIKEGTIDMGAYEYQAIPVINKVIYVKEGASGDGSTWTNALGDLQEAINKSNSGDSIWVAKGTYKPVRKADNLSVITENHRDNAFVLKKNIKVFGGFSGNETRFSQRDWKSNPAILSGDLGIQGVISDNAYHVVVASGDLGEAELDGFTLTAGNADNTNWSVLTVNGNNIFRNCGGAIYVASSSLVFNNLIIKDNQSFTSGGGIRLDAANVEITNSIFSNNKVVDGSFGGGALYNNKGTVSLYNSLFYKNKSGRGSGIYNEGAKNMSLVNVTMSDNEGRTIYNDAGSSIQIHNTIIRGDSGTNYGKLEYTHSLIQGVTGTDSKGNISGNTDPLFANSNLFNYQLRSESPVIDKGNNTYLLPKIDTDLAGERRISGKSVDMGAYEFQGIVSPVTVLDTEKEGIEESILEIYPNPVLAHQKVQVRTNLFGDQAYLSIYDMIGNLVHHVSFLSKEISITMPGKPGIYILKITNEEGVSITKRIIVR